jgi:hypothetical protein
VKNETDLWQNLRKIAPRAERVENAIKVGTPDVSIPLSLGWFWIELKLLRGSYFYQERFQSGFLVRAIKHLGNRLAPFYLVWDADKDLYWLYTGAEILQLEREPYRDKIKLLHDTSKTPCGLVDLLGKMEVYIKI